MCEAPRLSYERRLWRQGACLVAGVDEVGRGPLAGPVAAGAVILPPGAGFSWLARVRDSKRLTPQARLELAECIRRDATAWAVAFVEPEVIDAVGIVEAVRLAMLEAVARLGQQPDHLLLDAFPLPASPIPQTPIVRGDSISLSIACASIIAKVARDRLMEEEDGRYAGYGFARNKGYGTSEHREALRRLGPCPIHRRSFAPVRKLLCPP